MSRELCIMACVFCRDVTFTMWLDRAHPLTNDPLPYDVVVRFGDKEFKCDPIALHSEASAKAFILGICGIESRNQLDTSAVAAERFHNLIRRPFLDWKAGQEIGQVLP